MINIEALTGGQFLGALFIALFFVTIILVTVFTSMSNVLVARHQAKRPNLLHCTHGGEHKKTQDEQDRMRQITAKLDQAAADEMGKVDG